MNLSTLVYTPPCSDAPGAQGPFTAEHLRALQQSGTVQEDTLVMTAAKGPSLLKDVMQMYEQHPPNPSMRCATCRSHAVLDHRMGELVTQTECRVVRLSSDCEHLEA